MNHLRAYSGSKIPVKRSEDDPMLKAMAEADETPDYGASYRRKPMTNLQGPVIGKKKKSRGGHMGAAYATTAPAPIHILPYVDEDEEDDGFGLSQTKKYPAISNKTMAEVLKRTNPDCLRSMAEIQAHVAINKNRASMGLRPVHDLSQRMGSEEQKLAEKFIAEMLAQKAHVLMSQKASDMLAQKVQEMSTGDGQGQGQGQEAFMSKEEKVQRAHLKLHKALGLQ